MNDLIEYKTEFGTILIESFEEKTVATRGFGPAKESIQKKFENAISVVKAVGDSVVEQARKIKDAPSEVSVEVGIKFSVEAGAIIAKTSSEGTLKLTLKWKNDTKKENNNQIAV